jgi:hypothetical protein
MKPELRTPEQDWKPGVLTLRAKDRDNRCQSCRERLKPGANVRYAFHNRSEPLYLCIPCWDEWQELGGPLNAIPRYRKNTMRYVEQEKLSRYDGGSDYDRDRPVILRTPDKVLWQWPGGNMWAGIGVRSYFSTKLMWTDRKQTDHTRPRDHQLHDMADGGRLGKKLLASYDDQIKEIFGIDFNLSEMYEPGNTIIVDAED